MKEEISEIPEKAGVYFFIDSNNEILYIGKSVCLKKRITDHFRKGNNRIFMKVERENYNSDNKLPVHTWDYLAKYLEKVPSLVFNKEQKKKGKIRSKTESIKYIVTDTDEEALTLEGCLISAIRPPLNRMMWKYPFIEVTLGEDIPRVLTAYQILHPESFIYGPFNIAANIDVAMEGFLMIYPICVHEKPIQTDNKRLPNCIKHQIKRCMAPCKYKDILPKYLEIVNEFIAELGNNGKNVVKKLEEFMRKETEEENFEGAAMIRDRIKAIEVLFTQKAIPVVLQKYYDQVRNILNNRTNYLEIINKIILNNGFERN